MIDLYYWQHSDRRWWLGLGEQTWRDETKRKEEICWGWDPPDEARSVARSGHENLPHLQQGLAFSGRNVHRGRRDGSPIGTVRLPQGS